MVICPMSSAPFAELGEFFVDIHFWHTYILGIESSQECHQDND